MGLPPHSGSELADALRAIGQEHVVAHWDTLDDDGRRALAEDLGSLDLALVQTLRERFTGDQPPAPPRALEPTDVTTWPLSDEEAARRRALGEAALRAGEVACLTVAGGQGTRLGLDGPKGAVGIGPVSGRSLFDLFAAKIAATQARYGVVLPWLVMTGPSNDAETRALFEAQGYFGLDPGQVHLFCQGTLPALDADGRLILAGPDRLFRSPDGHGGTVAALADAGLLERLAAAGVKRLFYFQVDNPLVVVACPLFLGEHLLREAEFSTKVVRKADPDEKVGVLGRVDGREGLIEYSDLDDEARAAREPDGSLRYWAGNIAIHVIELGLLRRAADDALPLHRAVKAIPRWSGGEVETVQGLKFERFIFDLLGRASRTAALEVAREREFAPVKNASGVDSLPVAQEMLVAEWRRWLAEAGLEASGASGASGTSGGAAIEICPRFAVDAAALAARADEARELLASAGGYLR